MRINHKRPCAQEPNDENYAGSVTKLSVSVTVGTMNLAQIQDIALVDSGHVGWVARLVPPDSNPCSRLFERTYGLDVFASNRVIWIWNLFFIRDSEGCTNHRRVNRWSKQYVALSKEFFAVMGVVGQSTSYHRSQCLEHTSWWREISRYPSSIILFSCSCF